MSAKSETFLPPHARHTSPRTPDVLAKVARKVGSLAPPPYQTPARQPLAGPTERHLAGLIPSAPSVAVVVTLREAVAAVSAFLAASDHALVSAARYETLGDLDTASRLYERSVLLEGLAERVAKVSRGA